MIKAAKRLQKRWLSSGARRSIRRLYPDIPDQYFPEPEHLSEIRQRHQFYSTQYQLKLEWEQRQSNTISTGVHLTFYPIAKNIRLVGTALYDGVRAGKKVVIKSGNSREASLLERKKLGSWNPWLWSRIPRGQLDNLVTEIDDSARAWPTYFMALSEIASPPRQKPDEPVWVGPEGPRMRRILEMAACVRHAFRLNPHMQSVVADHARRMNWSEDSPKVGIHLRRGDAASEDLSKQTRPSWPLQAYLSKADSICERYGISTIYLSTESQSEIESAKSLRPQYRFLSLDHDRSVFPRISDTNLDIEIVALKKPSVVEPIVNSAVADLYFLGRCNAFIGAFNSEFSLLAWLTSVGEHGYVLPYNSMVSVNELEYFQGRLRYDMSTVKF